MNLATGCVALQKLALLGGNNLGVTGFCSHYKQRLRLWLAITEAGSEGMITYTNKVSALIVWYTNVLIYITCGCQVSQSMATMISGGY